MEEKSEEQVGGCDSNRASSNTSIGNEGTHNGEQEERQEQELGESFSGKIVTNTNRKRCEAIDLSAIEKKKERPNILCGWKESWYEVAARFCRVDDGIPDRVHRLKSLGNAIVPQIAYILFEAIKQLEENDD